MPYRLVTEPGHLSGRDARAATVVLVGCGGTGGFLAEALCRLLVGVDAALLLVDHDRVEPHNVGRQAFDPADVGRFKAQVLAERLAKRFRREVGYSVLPYSPTIHAEVFRAPAKLDLIVGAVDNAVARRALAATLGGRGPYAPSSVWWLDAGNARNDGQILLGNAVAREGLRGAFNRDRQECTALPAPSLQRPDLLTAPPLPELRPGADCAERIHAGEQGRTINQVVASIAASFVEKLLDGTCAWLDAYFNLDDGSLVCRQADPRLVAGMVGCHPRTVLRARRSAA